MFLIGMRGSGKSTIGRQLANQLQVPFSDLDDLAREGLGGRSVVEIWDADGESAWRDAEAAAFAAYLETSPATSGGVLALGGGAAQVPAIHKGLLALRQSACRIIWLRATVETLRQRLLQSNTDRPSLTGKEVAEEISEVLVRREPVYAALATRTIDVDHRSISEIVQLLVAN